MIGRMELLWESPHRRYDPLRDTWVLVSPGRTNRPWSGAVEQAAEAERPAYDPECYLCPGNRRANGEANPAYGSTFVFTNDYAALQPDMVETRWTDGLLRAESVAGTCRVVCFSPRHDLTLASLPPAEVRAVVDAWADQTTELGERFGWVQVFENRGTAMGASNPHPHGQIWAETALPSEGARELATQQRHYLGTGRHLLIDYGTQEAGGERRLFLMDHWQAVVPFWAVWPFETLVLPRRPVTRLADLNAAERDGLVVMMQAVVGMYDRLFAFSSRTQWAGIRRRSPTMPRPARAGPCMPTTTRPFCARRPCASSWSAMSCYPSRSVISRPKRPPRGCAASANGLPRTRGRSPSCWRRRRPP
jgi:UDPglucose--hexose-1-phosphate uridylyltransferase